MIFMIEVMICCVYEFGNYIINVPVHVHVNVHVHVHVNVDANIDAFDAFVAS
jgi:hypothetical protein